MKNIFIVKFILITFFCYSQNLAVEINLTHHLIPTEENYISIVVENVECGDLLVETTNGYIINQCNCDFILKPREFGSCTLNIYNKSTKKLIAVKQIRVLKWPISIVDFDLNKTGKIFKNELYKSEKQTLRMREYTHNGRLRIRNFKYKVIRNGSTIADRKIKGDKFDETFIKNIPLLKHNDFVIIYDAEVRFPGEVTTRVLVPYSFVIQEYEEEDISEAYFNINCIPNYFKDTTSQFITKYFQNEKPMVELYKKDGKWRRKIYSENGSLYQDAEVKLVYLSDTIAEFNCETYEELVDINNGYTEILDGYFSQYYPKKNLNLIELQGRMNNNLKEGRWLFCMYPDENNKQTCYEAFFENDMMIGEIKKINPSEK